MTKETVASQSNYVLQASSKYIYVYKLGEAGWSQTIIRNNRVGSRDLGSLKTQLQSLWKSMSNHRSAWPFHEPVDTTVVTDYLDIVAISVDLSLIQKRVEENVYVSKAAFKADLDLMCENCMTYNSPDTNYYK
jgi:hypothetical protein